MHVLQVQGIAGEGVALAQIPALHEVRILSAYQSIVLVDNTYILISNKSLTDNPPDEVLGYVGEFGGHCDRWVYEQRRLPKDSPRSLKLEIFRISTFVCGRLVA